jgi:Fe-S cluster assembly iron-binding protein IscA
MIEISDVTKIKISEILQKNPGKCLRIIMEGTGCGGPYLKLFMDEPLAHEKIIQINGINVVMSEDVRKYADATTVEIFFNPSGEDLT